jgi:hypothetical protein
VAAVPLMLLRPLMALVAEAALKVVDEKPQEETASSTSVDAVESLAEDHWLLSTVESWILRTILLVVGIVELADASGALGELRAGAAGVADAVGFFAVSVDCVIAGASGVDHGLADWAALRGDVVVVEFLGRDGVESG